MITLKQMRGAQRGRELSFDTPRVRVGRLEDNDLCFDPVEDLDVSGRHAEIHQAGGGCLIVDVGSLNGTWVNGKRIEQALLKTGDEIDFGQHGPRLLVTFVSDNPEMQSKTTMSEDTSDQAARLPLLTDPMPQPPISFLPTLDPLRTGERQRARIPTLPPLHSATPSWKSVLLWSFGMLGVLTVVAYAVTNWRAQSNSQTLQIPLEIMQQLQTPPLESLEIWCVDKAAQSGKICAAAPVNSTTLAVEPSCIAKLTGSNIQSCWVQSTSGTRYESVVVQPALGLVRLNERREMK